MADNADVRGDRTRINLSQEHDARYWSEKFQVTREALQQAVEAAGPMAIAVERQLRDVSARF
jgi:hypothetical protein